VSKRELDLVLFRTFAGRDTACFSGRVLYKSQLVGVERHGGIRGRLRDAWRLLVSRRVPRAALELHFGEESWTTTTDRHGYFFTCEHHNAQPVDGTWATYRCTAQHDDCVRPIEAQGQLLTAPKSARRLVISDIDDTVLHTGVAHKLKMLWRLYFADGDDRRPFPGMDEFLRDLHGGADGSAKNPMLYVSRSPWSIYPMLDAFFNEHNIPIGPVLLLRDWGISWRHPLPRRAEDHKARMIDSALSAFGDLPAILIGDSGQHDPEVYADVVRRHPGRIEAVYIRDLSLSGERSAELEVMTKRLSKLGVDLVVSNDTQGFMSHARQRSFVPRDDSVQTVHQI